MKNFVRFTDFFTTKNIKIQDDEKTKKDFGFMFGSPTLRKYRASSENLSGVPQSIGVKIAATHSGKVTGNNGFYLPDKMMTGTSSWTTPFPKPLLLHHDTSEDAIGRIKEARYVDISTGFRQDHLKRKDSISGNYPSDVLIDAFLSGKLSPRETVDVIKNVFLVKDFNYTKDPSYPGLGYIEISASVSDPDSIRKVLDERYLTGSIGARTDAAICTICKKDWANDGLCDHEPGKEYEGVMCALVAGNLTYDEYSFVNRPADPQSKTIELFYDGEIKNSFNFNQWTNDTAPEVGFNIVDSLTIYSNDKQEQDGMKLTLEDVQRLLIDFVGKNFPELSDFIDFQSLAQKFFDTLEEEITEDQLVQKFSEQLNKYNLSFGDAEDLLGKDPTEEDYMYVDMLLDAKLGKLEMTDEEVKALFDAKLSSKKRKSLSSSTFCGPNRSFPVPDCAHVTAARRLIGRYKGPGNKSTILACVSRKAKRLGCDAQEDKVEDVGVGEFIVDYFDNLSDTEVLQMLNGLSGVLEERNLSNPNGCKETKDRISTLENRIKELEELDKDDKEREALKQELANALDDNKTLNDKILSCNNELKDNLLDKIAFLSKLSGKEITDELKTGLQEKSHSELLSYGLELEDKVDVEKLHDMLKLGIARQPSEKIEDPTLKKINDGDLDHSKADSKIEDNKELVINKEYLMKIQEQYLLTRMKHGPEAANSYLDELKVAGLLPTEIPENKQ